MISCTWAAFFGVMREKDVSYILPCEALHMTQQSKGELGSGFVQQN